MQAGTYPIGGVLPSPFARRFADRCVWSPAAAAAAPALESTKMLTNARSTSIAEQQRRPSSGERIMKKVGSGNGPISLLRS